VLGFLFRLRDFSAYRRFENLPVTQPLQVHIEYEIEEIIQTPTQEEEPRVPKLQLACIGDSVVVIKHPTRENSLGNYAVACKTIDPPSL
jgi:hypothetical protein